jgi:hypothetical protein
MGVEAAIALLSAAASSTATEAGRAAWESLVALGRRVTGRGGEAAPAVPESVDPRDDEAVRVLTGRLADRARADADVAAELCRWAETHRAALEVDQSDRRGDVHNEIAGNATIEGPVIQARDIHGGINFGS